VTGVQTCALPIFILVVVLGRVVAGTADGGDRRVGGVDARHHGALGGVVDGGVHAVELVQLPFDAVRARRAGHPRHVQDVPLLDREADGVRARGWARGTGFSRVRGDDRGQ